MERKVENNLFHLTKILWNWLAVKDTPKKSDLIFLFGGDDLQTPKKGLELFQKGLAPLIVATGKTGTFTNPDWQKPIADIFADFLIKNGVPIEKVIIQNTSLNTLEDITQAIKIFKERKIHFKKIILIAKPHHQRRGWATFKKQFPDLEYINIPNGNQFPNENEIEKLKEVSLLCLGEYERLEKYAEKGDLEKQAVPQEIQETYQKLKFLS